VPTEIWDTNVFRNIGEGDLPPNGGKADGVDVCYSPVSVLELASKYTEGSFEHRRNAARAIRDSGATLLPDPELYLTGVFGLPLAEDEFDWRHAVDAMADSVNMERLQQGVADYAHNVKRRVNVVLARSYCEGIEKDFVRDMLQIQRSEIPTFSAYYDAEPRVGNVPRLQGVAREVFLAKMDTPLMEGELMFACAVRGQFKSSEPLPWPPTEAWVAHLAAACDTLEFYCSVYTRYVIRLCTEGMLPRANDWFDLEILMYSSSDDRIVVTSDGMWQQMAAAAGMGQRIVVRP
jgi:hypothetical protein